MNIVILCQQQFCDVQMSEVWQRVSASSSSLSLQLSQELMVFLPSLSSSAIDFPSLHHVDAGVLCVDDFVHFGEYAGA